MFPKGLYSLYDKVIRQFTGPFVAVNDDEGVREFLNALQNPKLKFSTYPQDYQLFRLGQFHEDTGAIEALGEIVKIHDGVGDPGTRLDVEQADSLGLQKLQAWLDRLGPEGAELRKRIAHGGNQ